MVAQRECLSSSMLSGPVIDTLNSPVSFLLVHFKSSDLARLHKQGRFWHLFILLDGTFGGACICQDEKVGHR